MQIWAESGKSALPKEFHTTSIISIQATNLITKIELGIRFATDYEIAIFAELLHTTPNDLLGFNDIPANK